MAATRRAAGLSAAALPRRQFVAASLSQPFSGPCRAGQRRHRRQVFPPETNTDDSASNGLTAVTDPASQNLSTQQQMHPYGEWIDDAATHHPRRRQPERSGRSHRQRRCRAGGRDRPERQYGGQTRVWPERRFPAGCRVYCFNSERTAWGSWLACAMAAMEACCNTCALVRLAACWATLASRICDWAAEKLVICDCARLMA